MHLIDVNINFSLLLTPRYLMEDTYGAGPISWLHTAGIILSLSLSQSLSLTLLPGLRRA